MTELEKRLEAALKAEASRHALHEPAGLAERCRAIPYSQPASHSLARWWIPATAAVLLTLLIALPKAPPKSSDPDAALVTPLADASFLRAGLPHFPPVARPAAPPRLTPDH